MLRSSKGQVSPGVPETNSPAAVPGADIEHPDPDPLSARAISADPGASDKGRRHASLSNMRVSSASNPASLPSTIPHTSRLSTVA